MLNKLKNRKGQSGFTIIEVMIVLAIAGLIMLIVFLAVPALQRNARNTQRKEDVANVASAISNYISNNSGTIPNAVATDATTATDVDVKCLAAGPATGCSSTDTNFEAAALGYYKPASIFVASSATTPTIAAPGAGSTTKVAVDSLLIDVGYGCNGTVVGGADSRSAAIFYALETTSTTTGNIECQDQ